MRQIVLGQRFFEEKFGDRCTEVWLPDVFGYPAALPQIFAAGGMDRFLTQKMSWNKQTKFPHNTFWWEGIDGTKVFTHFPPVDTYNAECHAAEFGSGHQLPRPRVEHGLADAVRLRGRRRRPDREMLEHARRLAHLDARVAGGRHPPRCSTGSTEAETGADAGVAAASCTSKPPRHR